MPSNNLEGPSGSLEASSKDLKSLCVLQRGNKFYFPKSIPRERGPLATYIRLCIILLLFLIDLFTNENKKTSVVALYLLALLLHIGLQLLHRIILVSEEFKHLYSRYDNDFKRLLEDAFHFPNRVLVVFFASVLYTTGYLFTNDFFNEFRFDIVSITCLLLPCTYLSGIMLELDTCSLNDSLWIAKNNGLNYGSGMAYSFFHGYLKLVIPPTGTQEKNLKELMQDYEAKNHIEFAVYKLFILIPKSLVCFVSLEDNSPLILKSCSLDEKIMTVAGVKDRVYKNAVYKINADNKKIYVSAEYATPLKTFKDVVNATGDHAEFYKKHKNDIILQFYLTLKKVLEEHSLSQFCELIYYEDSFKDKENQTCYYDVGKIILTRLKELKKQREKSD